MKGKSRPAEKAETEKLRKVKDAKDGRHTRNGDPHIQAHKECMGGKEGE